jgi:hypothetical protein
MWIMLVWMSSGGLMKNQPHLPNFQAKYPDVDKWWFLKDIMLIWVECELGFECTKTVTQFC